MFKSVLTVFCGGFIGVALRYLTNSAIPKLSVLPVGIALINLIGCFALGFLTTFVKSRAISARTKLTIRLFLGTGLLGGFTTYSAVVVDSNLLLANGYSWLATFYPFVTIVLGIVFAGLGVGFANKLALPKQTTHHPQSPNTPTHIAGPEKTK
ncbi:fluoride efflux transporter FluC [Arcanobacterium ihumii]|uniref:fluoride efflux transporter FluC n=1 Tax=Arcanobacterium ihumii TaxID=2138162 RepID=UPI000F52A092|nr:CrcB family protein [Arcanobacterium ihumii]